jgi:cell division GTPase FtsZ
LVGGAGGITVSNLIMTGLEGVSSSFPIPTRRRSHVEDQAHLQMGRQVTKAGRAVGVGRAAAEEDRRSVISVARQLFITPAWAAVPAGAAPIIAKTARELILHQCSHQTGHFEGQHRMHAETIAELRWWYTLLIIPNQNSTCGHEKKSSRFRQRSGALFGCGLHQRPHPRKI